MDTETKTQAPVAVLGYSCRLPGKCSSPRALWDFLSQGSIAKNESPEDSCRFTKATHYDGSGKPGTMPALGGMFLEEVDLSAFDAFFFNISSVDATSMDPQQRLLLEVTYECLENSGVTLEQVRGTNMGCIVANNGVEYEGTAYRDPEEQAIGKSTGYSRSILSNRISHFLDIHGPSITIDTACSGTMTALDMACQTLDLRRADGVIVAGATLYYDPITLEDHGPMKEAFSRTGQCHAFDAKADGYVRAEAINAVHLKRLDDAIRDGDPIRAVIRGTAVNSDGRTPGITSPNPEAQAAAIRAAYRHAGISSFDQTAFLECHGTGTYSGDPLEVEGLASVFAPSRSPDQSLIIGSIKSNIGHSEAAAGLSGLIKAAMALEKGIIPGNPTFKTPNPKIDFEGSRVRVAQGNIPWPSYTDIRRASVNSFGFGGANGHCVLEATDSYLQDWDKSFVSSHRDDGYSSWMDGEDDFDDEDSGPLHLLTFSANDRDALAQNVKAMSDHLIHPAVTVALADVAYTLSERRTHHFHKAFIVTDTTEFAAGTETVAKHRATPPRVGFIFTGQGAQWSAMGKDLLQRYPLAREVIQKLETALGSLPQPPSWSLSEELMQKRDAEHLRRPEISQPIVTALQLVQLRLLTDWGVRAGSAVGHSSGEIAAAVAAGLISEEEAIKVAYLRGQAAKTLENPEQALGMLAVGLSAEDVAEYLEGSCVHVACFNSPKSLTLSGPVVDLRLLCDRIAADGHFARMLQVDLAYHSIYMADIAVQYEKLLLESGQGSKNHHISTGMRMYSSVTGKVLEIGVNPGVAYWRRNMTSPVRFNEALTALLSNAADKPEFLIEIGPSNALSGPVGQVINALGDTTSEVQYMSAAKRGPDSLRCLLTTVGSFWANGGNVNMTKLNAYERPSLVVDLPNYQWNHSHRYWHQGLASTDWQHRKFISHDLLGSKVLATSWQAPCWTRIIRLEDLPWLRDHEIGGQVLFPAAGFLAMAMEAAYQTTVMNVWLPRGDPTPPAAFNYHLEKVQFLRGLEITDVEGVRVQVTMTPVYGPLTPWHDFKVMSVANDGTSTLHCTGLARVSENDHLPTAPDGAFEPLEHAQSGDFIYKKLLLGGYNYGAHFRRLVEIQWVWGEAHTKGTLSMAEPDSKYKQSRYPIHPVSIDSFLQFAGYAVVQKQMKFGFVDNILVPGRIDSITIPSGVAHSELARVMVSAAYSGEGRLEAGPSYSVSGGAYDPEDGHCVVQIKGMHFNYIERPAGTAARHPYSRLTWKADMGLTDEPSLKHLLSAYSTGSASWVNGIMELLHHANPAAQVVEVNTNPESTSCLSLQGDPDHADSSSSVPYAAQMAELLFISGGPKQLLEIQDRHSAIPNAKFKLLDATTSGASISSEHVDFALLHIGPWLTLDGLKASISNIIHSLNENGQLLVVGNTGSEDSAPFRETLREAFVQFKDLSGAPDQLAILLQTPVGQRRETADTKEIICVQFSQNSSAVSSVIDRLQATGFNIRTCDASSEQVVVAPSSIVICLDELFDSVTVSLKDSQWNTLKSLIQNECRLLWVTSGAQLNVTDPNRAASQGLLRVIRNEEPHLSIMTLDVEDPGLPSSVDAIKSLLKELCVSASEPSRLAKQSEFAEANGCIFAPKIVPDEPINEANYDKLGGRKEDTVSFSDTSLYVQLNAERNGVMDSFEYIEVATGTTELAADYVEIDVHATGINYKDLMQALGHFGGMDDYSIGSEGAGIVTRVGSQVTTLQPGQRVAVFWQGMLSNKIRAPAQCTYPILDGLSFDQAASMPAAYIIALHGLEDLSRLEKGQRVLIHSATGGVGCAAVQLAKHIGAEIFATAGSSDKREFLETLGIPRDHIFSSRDTEFERLILEKTDGYGVDVVLNSLSGDLLEASWNIIAAGGTFVEVGKRDMYAHNRLSMEPFKRGASFRAIDLKLQRVDLGMISRLLRNTFELLEAGDIKPVFPIQTFAYDKVPEALHALRDGTCIGKLVVSREANKALTIPVRPMERKIKYRNNACYIIVGGLKGLGGSMAVELARGGAKYVAAVSRSGYDDKASKTAIHKVRCLGSHIDLLRGDITQIDDVRAVFKQTSKPVGGIIQGAMVLRDHPFSTMSIQDLHDSLGCKVQGTWNLHNVAVEQGLNLDFFTSLSSISSVLGTKGQANYSAGNSFLDAFASYRIRLGLPANTINLGVIPDIGYIARNDDLLDRYPENVTPHQSEPVLSRILQCSILQQSSDPINRDSVPQMITGLAYPQPMESSLQYDARFAHLFTSSSSIAGQGGDVAGKGPDGSSGDSQQQQELRELKLLIRSDSTLQSALLGKTVAIISAYLANMLRLREALEPERPLSAYGMDSLAAVEFRNWVRRELGAVLSMMDVATAKSLLTLCQNIVQKMQAVQKG